MTPLTLGTAGHIDHGKTALVAALTGTSTDRLEEERRRGISIEVGFAELRLPDGSAISVVDVPGHHRLVRAMVAGSTGIDMFLLVIAGNDGVMPQTREHWRALRALGIDFGIIALSKCDTVKAEALKIARAEAMELAPDFRVVEVSSRTGSGLNELRNAIGEVAKELADGRRSRELGPAASPVLHLDRVFTLRGMGTVVTGTLRSGILRASQRVRILPSGRIARVRSIEIHGRRVEAARPGGRVALNLAGIHLDEAERGDVVVAVDAALAGSYRLDVALHLDPTNGELPGRVQVHHGAREAPARVVDLGGGLAQLRLESPLIAEVGDRAVIRRIAPPDTIGGAVVIDPCPSRHGAGSPGAEAAREAAGGRPEDILERAVTVSDDGLPEDPSNWLAIRLLGFALPRFDRERWIAATLALEEREVMVQEGGRWRLVRHGSAKNSPGDPPELGPVARKVLNLLDADGLRPRSVVALAGELKLPTKDIERGIGELEVAGHAVRLRHDVVYPADRLAWIADFVTKLARSNGSVGLGELRDTLEISRKYSQAILEWLDDCGVTVRHGDHHALRHPVP